MSVAEPQSSTLQTIFPVCGINGQFSIPPHRTPGMKTQIAKAMRVAVNVLAYATGGTLLNKLEQAELAAKTKQKVATVPEGYLQIAKIKHTGDWDAAPSAIKRLLEGLRSHVGASTSTKPVNIQATDPQLFRHGLVYMHGQQKFRLTNEEKKKIKTYLENGGVLFADSCCGADKFDASFRELMKELFPQNSLEQIPFDHEMFTDKVGQNIQLLERRSPELGNADQPLKSVNKKQPPFLEGVKLKERYAVIYSKYDISCALERQTSVECLGYTPEDALKLAINVVMYSILQDAAFQEILEKVETDTATKSQ